jgi:hypothetical protein
VRGVSLGKSLVQPMLDGRHRQSPQLARPQTRFQVALYDPGILLIGSRSPRGLDHVQQPVVQISAKRQGFIWNRYSLPGLLHNRDQLLMGIGPRLPIETYALGASISGRHVHGSLIPPILAPVDRAFTIDSSARHTSGPHGRLVLLNEL